MDLPEDHPEHGLTCITLYKIDAAVVLPHDLAGDGEPIPPSAQEQIFIPFYTTKKEGSGIGLSISRQIMRNHNGSIELVCSDNDQTVFELCFR